MTLDTFKKLAQTYTAIPVYRLAFADTLTPVSVFLSVRQGAVFPFLLESVEGGEQLARFSFIGRNPYQILVFENGKTILSANGQKKIMEGGYYDNLNLLLGSYKEPSLPDMPRLTGGAVGYSSYDTIRQTEYLPNIPKDDLQIPDAMWAFYDEIFAFDHVKHRIVLIKMVFTDGLSNQELDSIYLEAQKSLDMMQIQLRTEHKKIEPFSLGNERVTSNINKENFAEIVHKAKKYIYEGDIFQVVLSQRFKNQFDGDHFMLYRALRMVNPSPYLFYLDFNSFALVGSSPEVLVSVQNKSARVLPIAGTRKRGETPQEDLELELDLAKDHKERAEHIMLVDLGRNDLSRICKPGTVKLTKNQDIVRYSHVMHIVSEVSGELSDTSNAVDALRHCFPAGTVSGAPKIRAMEIIDELESVKRGPYAGAVGYFDFSGNMDTCIAIRTMVIKDNHIYIQAGAGIVADSIPENEYYETVNKAKALVEALSMALNLES